MRNALLGWAAVSCLVFGALSGAARAQVLELVTHDAQSPSYLADPGDGRLFISELTGRVRIFQNGRPLQASDDAFLDIHGSVSLGDVGEGGMHSLAFDPNFATNHYVYVEYTRAGTNGRALDTVIARYTVKAGDPDHADPASAHTVVVLLGTTFPNHKGGQLQFGPDGYLYFAWGDGGSQDNPGCEAQERDSLLGKIIRIDPSGDDFADPEKNYAIPPTNPFAAAGDGILDEIWAFGFRNPYRFSFDKETGDLWVGDVGGSDREELDMSPAPDAGRGKNYGWKVWEGIDCHIPTPGAALCADYVVGCTPGQPMDASYTPPFVDFAHGGGDTIIGGYVYRGAVTAFQGRYIFADYGRDDIFVLTDNGGTPDRQLLLHVDGLGPASFGQDHNGELYVLGLGNDTVSHLNLGSAPLTKQQVACVAKLNAVFAKVAAVKSAQVRACVAQDALGRLGQTADQCVDDDPKGVLEKVRMKAEALDTALCTPKPPDSGYAGADTGHDAAILSETDFARDVLGDVLDAGIIPFATSKAAAACQNAVLKALAVCQNTRRAEFLRCKLTKLKSKSLDGLAACLSEDEQQRVAKICDSGSNTIVRKTIATTCTARGVNLAAAFPGCGTADADGLAACLDAAGRCRACQLFEAADALGTDCTDACAP